MNNKMKRLELESTLNQIYHNDYTYDGPPHLLLFENVDCLAINNLKIYTYDIAINFHINFLQIVLDNAVFEIDYNHIKFLSLNFKEDSDVS